MNRININNIYIKENRIEINYSLQGEWTMYFYTDEVFFVEYSTVIDNVPKSIAVIPFLCNILPISWVFDAEVRVTELDKEFYESIEKFKQGYIDMYPQLNFKGSLIIDTIVDNEPTESDNSAILFSGGVDAFQSLITQIEKKPTLVTLWGSDIKLEDFDGWKVVEKHINQVASENKLDYVIIKSSFRKFINEGKLSQYTISRVKDGWWHGFQHGIGLIGHMAPYAYQYKVKNIYIASSFTIVDKGKVTCASDPTIDNFVRFCGSQVFHDGYDFNRQEKIHRICKYVKNTGSKLELRVCWESSGGSNCCHCEKCYRTILGIIAEREDPRIFGFDYTNKEFKYMMKDFKKVILVRVSNYIPIQEALRKNYTKNQLDPNLRWFYNTNILNINNNFSKNLFRVKRKFVNLLEKIKG